jgi:hypothetical protein
MTWNNPIPNSLWFTTLPTPATIVFDGTYYNLFVPALGASYKYSPTTLDGAMSEFSAQATKLLAQSITLVPSLPSLVLPADGQIVGIGTTSGSVKVGVWSEANQSVSVAAETIPVANIVTWSPIPSVN